MKNMLKRSLLMLLAALVVMTQMAITPLFAVEGFPPADETPLNGEFNDKNLLNAILKAVGKEDGDTLTYGDAKTLTEFTYTNKGLQDLKGIQYLTGLTSLDLSNNLLQDLTPLSGDYTKPNLTTLNLSGNKLEALAPISTLPTITNLDVSKNLVADTGPISLLTNLKVLNISENKILNAGGLHFTTKLEVLDISDNQLVDSGAFDQLANLKTLDASNNKIVDMGGLASTEDGANPPLGLTNLNMSGNAILDMGTVALLPDLTDLDLSCNAIQDAAPVAGLTNLNNLNLSYTKIADITPLKALAEANSGVALDLSGSKVAASDIAILNEILDKPVEENSSPSVPGTGSNTGTSSYTIKVSVDGNGTAYSDYTMTPAGYKIHLKKSAGAGYEFDKWVGNVVVTDDSFIMPAYNVEITAVFKDPSAEETPVETEDINLGAGVEESAGTPVSDYNGSMAVAVTALVVVSILVICWKKKEN